MTPEDERSGYLKPRPAGPDDLRPERNLVALSLGAAGEARGSEATREARTLIDGDPATAFGFQGEQVLLSCHEGRPMRIAGFVLFPHSGTTPTEWPAEVHVGHRNHADPNGQYEHAAFLRIGTASEPHAFDLSKPLETRHLMLVTKGGRGGNAPVVGDFAVLAVPGGEPPGEVNVLWTRCGGCVVGPWLPQAQEAGALGKLIDGLAESGWRAPDAKGTASLVFAFRGNLPTRIGRIRIDPDPAGGPNPWVRDVRILLGDQSPFGPYRELGVFHGAKPPAPLDVDAGEATARFLRLDLLSTHGRVPAAVGEVRVYEAPGTAGGSVLVRPLEAGAIAASESQLIQEFEAQNPLPEKEPNSTIAEATAAPLERWLKGTLSGAADVDVWSVTLTDPARDRLEVDLSAFPFVRASAALLDSTGKELARYDPGADSKRTVRFSWKASPGTYSVRLTQSPALVALVFDCSNSMEGRLGDLEAALRAYVRDVSPNERLALVKFSDKVKTLCNFTADSRALETALAGQIVKSGGTAIYDALEHTAGLFATAPGGGAATRVVILMSDGLSEHDQKLPYPRFWPFLENTPAVMYAIGLGRNLQFPAEKLGCTPSRLLENIAFARSGKYFHAPESNELGGLYRRIAGEIKQDFPYYIRFQAAGSGKGVLETGTLGQIVQKKPKEPPGKLPGIERYVELVLDASYSMLEPLEGRTKIDIAKDVLGKIVRGLPENNALALRAYGTRCSPREGDYTHDSEILVPMASLKKSPFLQKVAAVKCKGSTPIAYSLSQVPQDLKELDVRRVTVILLSDGEETCGGDPVRETEKLRQSGIDVQVHVIAFGVKHDSKAAEQLRAVAEAGGGDYYEAENAQELIEALRGVFDVRVFRVVDAKGMPVAQGTFGDRCELPTGKYVLITEIKGREVRFPVEVRSGKTSKVVLSPQDGSLTATE